MALKETNTHGDWRWLGCKHTSNAFIKALQIGKVINNYNGEESMIHRIEKARQDAYEIFYQNSHVPGRYAAYIRGTRCATDAGFLKEISAAMQFPDYFGENWNAWEECMTDLDWLSFSSITLVIDDYEVLFEEEKEPEDSRRILETYFKEIIAYWENENGVPFEVFLMQ